MWALFLSLGQSDSCDDPYNLVTIHRNGSLSLSPLGEQTVRELLPQCVIRDSEDDEGIVVASFDRLTCLPRFIDSFGRLDGWCAEPGAEEFSWILNVGVDPLPMLSFREFVWQEVCDLFETLVTLFRKIVRLGGVTTGE
jgi:hypothetical protein